jgi:acyl carrier protein
MPSSTDLEVLDFVAHFVGVPSAQISASTTLFGDLGVDGEDGSELMVAFGKQFNVDLSTLDVTRHFGPEGLWPWAPLRWLALWLRPGTPEGKARLLPITITDLVRAAELGTWSNNQ